jgi:integrase/recombinase XerD
MEQQVVDFLEHLSRQQGRAANTIAAYRNDLEQFVEFAQGVASPPMGEWRELTPECLQAYLRFLNTHTKAYTPATVARKLAAVKRFCEFLHQTEQIETNFAKSVRLPKVTKNLPHTMRAEEISRLLAEPARHHTPQARRDWALLETLYATGMRVSELVELNLKDLDLEAKQIRCGANGKHSRTVSLSDQAVTALDLYLREGRLDLVVDRSEPALFLNHRGQRLTRQGLWLIIKRYVEQVGIETPVTPHTLRHSFAAHLLNSGAALREVKERLGYAHLSSTQIYQQVANGVAAELVIDGQPVVYTNGKH